MEAVAFKQRRRQAASRKRSRRAEAADEAEGEGGGGGAGADTLRVIEEVQADQRLRAQALRLELADRAASGGRRGQQAQAQAARAEAEASAAEYGLHDPKTDGAAGQKLRRLLDGQFTGQRAGSQRDQHEELLCVAPS